MSKISSYLKKLKLHQILTVFLTGLILLVTTACNSGDKLGARPENPPVQVGGQNNPHKRGGDGYTQYKASPDPKVKSQSSLPGEQLLAQGTYQSPTERQDKMLYKHGTETNEQDIPIINSGEKDFTAITAESQKSIDRSNPGENILEKTGEAFSQSTRFFREGVDKAFDNDNN